MRPWPIAAGLAFALILAACGNEAQNRRAEGPEGAEAGSPGLMVMHRGNGTEPDTLDPQKSSGKWESDIIGEMILGLATEAQDGEAIPGVAESYTVSDDALVWTFKLREDMTWSDGVPVTADDFIFAHRRLLDPKTAAQYASLIYVIAGAQAINEGRAAGESLGVRALDDKTLEYTLAYPAPYFFELARHQTMKPVPRHVVEVHGDDWVKPENIVVNGPYTLAEWVPNAHVKLVKNPSFYEADKVAVDEIYFYPISDQSVETKRYKAGEFDATSSLPARELPKLKEQLGDQVRVHPYMVTTYLQVNTSREPFTDVRVRRALSMALDRKILALKILNAGQVPAYGLVPPGMANYANGATADFHDKSMPERRQEAARLLEEAGFGPDNPLEIEFKYMDSQDTRRIAVAIQSMWNTIGTQENLWERQGVKVSILNSETKVLYNSLRTQDFDVATAGWVADYNDPENYLFLLQSTSGQMNYSKYHNPAYDALMAEAANTTDLEARAQILEKAEQIIIDDVPLIPLYFGASRHLVKPYVKGWVGNLGDWNRTRYITLEQPGASD